MIERLTVRTFKSLDDVRVELGLVNVFLGANGSGKSNLLEALGVLSAAADGKVDDLALLARGVRPGLPAQYKSAFPAMRGKKIPPSPAFRSWQRASPVRSVASQSPGGSGACLEVQDRAVARGWRQSGSTHSHLGGQGQSGTRIGCVEGRRNRDGRRARPDEVAARLRHILTGNCRPARRHAGNAAKAAGGSVRRKPSAGNSGFAQTT